MSVESLYINNLPNWIEEALQKPKNLASETELKEQAKVALNYFIQADIDKSDSLSFAELKRLCDEMGLPMGNDEEEALFKMDTDGSGALDIEEWTKWWLGRISTLPNPSKQQEAIATNTFKKLDVDGSGYLDASELRTLITQLGADFSDEELAQAIEEIDSDSSGVIECSEFVFWWTNRTLSSRNSSSLVGLKLRKLAAKANRVFYTDIFTAAWKGDEDLVKTFVDSEKRLAMASDDSEYGGGWQPLHYASYQGHLAIVEILLKAGANVNATNDAGFTALFYAAQRGNIDICKILFESGADPTITGVDRENENIFMSPADHCSEYKELRALFKEHNKIKNPRKVTKDDFAVKLSVFGHLTLIVTANMKNLSTLPVQKWLMTLSFDISTTDAGNGNLAPSMVLQIAAGNPTKPQTLQCNVDKKWLQTLHWQYYLSVLDSMKLAEGNNKSLSALWIHMGKVYQTIDPKFQKKVNIEQKLINAIEAGPEDGTSTVFKRSIRNKFQQAHTANSSLQEGEEVTTDNPLSFEQIDELVKSITMLGSATTLMNPNASKTNLQSGGPSAADLKQVNQKAASSSSSLSKGKSSDLSKTQAENSIQSKQRKGSIDIFTASGPTVWAKIAPITAMFEGEYGEETIIEVEFPSIKFSDDK